MNLTVVAPVFNEAGVLRELAARGADAARATDLDFEVLRIDDASTDTTPAIAATLDSPVFVHRLPTNQGQFGAIQEGIRRATGDLIVVLDGDLQDPPEAIVDLVARWDPDTPVVFAVKRSRKDVWWFTVGNTLYRLAVRAGGVVVPPGAGTYCLMHRDIAGDIAKMHIQQVNLSALISALGCRHGLVEYDKAARYDGVSRVGLLGLVREALSSLAITGALSRWARFAAFTAAIAGVLNPWGFRFGWIGVALVGLAGSAWLDLRVRRALRPQPLVR